MQEEDVDLRGVLLLRSRNEALEALRWNPFYARGLSQVASVTRELARARPELAPEAIRAYRVWAELQPGFWQPELGLANAYLMSDQPQLAVEALDRVLAMTSDHNANTKALRLQAVAYQKLGRQADAEAADEAAQLLRADGRG